jgi:hypothetical protein
MGLPIRHHLRTNMTAPRTHKAIAYRFDWSLIRQMADIHDCAVIAMIGITIDQKVTATLRPHMAQSHRCKFPNFGRRHVRQFAPPSAFGQHRRRASSWARLARGGSPGNA